LFRAEYQTQGYGLGQNFDQLHDLEIPCAICRYTAKVKQLMVPGKQSCPTGMAASYFGYLFAPFSGASRGQYICLDQEAQGIGSISNEDGHLLSPVEATTDTSGALFGYVPGMEVC
jgi:hypothetical protein